MITERRQLYLLQIIAASAFMLLRCSGQAAQEAARPAATPTVRDVQLSFKRDPRMVDPTRGSAMGPWASGPNYVGAYAQDAVEVRAQGVDAAGKLAKISPKWIPSDPEMVTVSPNQGDDVQIKVRQAGESTLKIVYQGLSKELVIKARYVNKFISFEIGEISAAPRPAPAAVNPASAPKSKQDVSYAAGMNLAKALQEQSVDLDPDLLLQGVRDTLSGGKTVMTEEQAMATLEGLQTDLRIARANLTRKALAEKNKREGEAFLAENKNKRGVVTLPSGLQYKIIKTGEGKRPTANDFVVCGYRGTFIDGREFADSYKQSASVTFPVKSVIKGWAEALQLMPVGSKWELFIPPELGYGERGASGGGRRRKGHSQQIVGPNATLIFELELLAVPKHGARPSVSNLTAQKNELTPEMMDQLKKATQSATRARAAREDKGD